MKRIVIMMLLGIAIIATQAKAQEALILPGANTSNFKQYNYEFLVLRQHLNEVTVSPEVYAKMYFDGAVFYSELGMLPGIDTNFEPTPQNVYDYLINIPAFVSRTGSSLTGEYGYFLVCSSVGGQIDWVKWDRSQSKKYPGLTRQKPWYPGEIIWGWNVHDADAVVAFRPVVSQQCGNEVIGYEPKQVIVQQQEQKHVVIDLPPDTTFVEHKTTVQTLVVKPHGVIFQPATVTACDGCGSTVSTNYVIQTMPNQTIAYQPVQQSSQGAYPPPPTGNGKCKVKKEHHGHGLLIFAAIANFALGLWNNHQINQLANQQIIVQKDPDTLTTTVHEGIGTWTTGTTPGTGPGQTGVTGPAPINNGGPLNLPH